MKKTHPASSSLRPLLVGGAVGVLCAAGFLSGALSSWSNRVTDRFFVPRTPDASIVIVAIDDTSLQRVGRWPWDRSVHAELIQDIASGGPVAIGYDVNFPEPQDEVNDTALADAVRAAGTVVLPAELTLGRGMGDRTVSVGAALTPLPAIIDAAAGIGHTNVTPDEDGVVRRLPLDVRSSDPTVSFTWPSFSEVLASLAGRLPPIQTIPQDTQGLLRIFYYGAPERTFPTVPASAVLSGAIQPSLFAGKIVLVGATAPDLHDEQLTSVGVMPGVEIHASLLGTLIERHWLQDVPAWITALLLLLIGILCGLIVPAVRTRWSTTLIVLLWIGTLVGTFALFDRGWVFDLLWPTIAFAAGYGAVTLERRLAAERSRREIKGMFSRYMSPSVVEALLADPSKLAMGGTRRRMTVFFSDIRGFTSIAESMRPERLVKVLNAYLDRMTDIVFAHGGVLDKYIGDAVMAFWNAPVDQPDHARRAVLTALAMRTALEEMNLAHKFGKTTLRIGVGIHTGDMVVGNIGGHARVDYTVIGDSVNLASRMEGLTKEYGVDILISEATAAEVGDEVLTRKLDVAAVKGKKEPVGLFEAVAFSADATPDDKVLVHEYENALGKYLLREFAEAAGICSVILKTHPEDGPTKTLLHRCAQFVTTPPPKEWNGVWVYTKK